MYIRRSLPPSQYTASSFFSPQIFHSSIDHCRQSHHTFFTVSPPPNKKNTNNEMMNDTNNDTPLLPSTSENKKEKKSKGASSFQTGLNMLNELEGQGLLGLPYAATLVGVVPASVSLVVVGAFAAFTGYLINGCMYDSTDTNKRTRVSSSYADLAKRTFGSSGETFCTVVQMTNLSFVGVVYLVLMGNALHNVYSVLDDDMNDRRLWIAISTLAAFPTVHLGGYKKISLLSFIGLVSIISIFVVGVYFSSKELSDHGDASFPEFKWINLPQTISIFLFAFSAHGIFPDLEDSMSDPSQFSKVVGTSCPSLFNNTFNTQTKNSWCVHDKHCVESCIHVSWCFGIRRSDGSDSYRELLFIRCSFSSKRTHCSQHSHEFPSSFDSSV